MGQRTCILAVYMLKQRHKYLRDVLNSNDDFMVVLSKKGGARKEEEMCQGCGQTTLPAPEPLQDLSTRE